MLIPSCAVTSSWFFPNPFGWAESCAVADVADAFDPIAVAAVGGERHRRCGRRRGGRGSVQNIFYSVPILVSSVAIVAIATLLAAAGLL